MGKLLFPFKFGDAGPKTGHVAFYDIKELYIRDKKHNGEIHSQIIDDKHYIIPVKNGDSFAPRRKARYGASVNNLWDNVITNKTRDKSATPIYTTSLQRFNIMKLEYSLRSIHSSVERKDKNKEINLYFPETPLVKKYDFPSHLLDTRNLEDIIFHNVKGNINLNKLKMFNLKTGHDATELYLFNQPDKFKKFEIISDKGTNWYSQTLDKSYVHLENPNIFCNKNAQIGPSYNFGDGEKFNLKSIYTKENLYWIGNYTGDLKEPIKLSGLHSSYTIGPGLNNIEIDNRGWELDIEMKLPTFWPSKDNKAIIPKVYTDDLLRISNFLFDLYIDKFSGKTIQVDNYNENPIYEHSIHIKEVEFKSDEPIKIKGFVKNIYIPKKYADRFEVEHGGKDLTIIILE